MIRLSLMSDDELVEFVLTHPVSGGKGDDAAKSTEKSTADFTNTLQGVFATNNASQQEKLNFLTKQLESGVTNPQGYSPETLASMRTQAAESGAQNNADVMQAVNEKNATQTSATSLPSGVQEQIQAGIAAKEAANESNQQLGITQANGQLQVENQNRDIAALEGVAQAENPTGFAGASNNAAGEVSNLSQAVTKANGPGVGSILGSIAGSALGMAGSALTGGATSVAGAVGTESGDTSAGEGGFA